MTATASPETSPFQERNNFTDLSAVCRYMGRWTGAYVLFDAALQAVTGHFSTAREEVVGALVIVGTSEVAAELADLANQVLHA